MGPLDTGRTTTGRVWVRAKLRAIGGAEGRKKNEREQGETLGTIQNDSKMLT